MEISELEAMADKDFEMSNPDMIDKKSLELPFIFNKWNKIFNKENRDLKVLEYQYKRLKFQRREFYLGNASPEEYKKEDFHQKILKTDVNVFLEGDKKLGAFGLKVHDQKIKVEYISNVLDKIRWMHTDLKNAIEWIKFTNGA